MNKADNIKSFVIDKLGCNCPAEVFNVIKWQKDVQINRDIVLSYNLDIGNRLLIYIIQIDDIGFLNDNFLDIIGHGISEKLNNNYNRFRLVILSDHITEIGPIAQTLFNNLQIDDQNVHLHIMYKRDLSI